MISSLSLGTLTTQTRETSATNLSAILAAVSDSSSSSTSSTSSLGQDSATISDPAQLFSDLKELQEKDPAKFKEVTADIATQLKSAAGSAEGDESKFLNFLASRFDAASQSGDVSDLLPPQPQNASGTYNSSGKLPPPPPPLADGSSTDLSDLFASIRSEVTAALSDTSE